MHVRYATAFCAAALLLGACTERPPADAETAAWTAELDSTQRVAVGTGFSGPEAVRYDPDQDVYFVSNFNGGGMDRDGNGFISRMTPDGTVDTLQFMTGGAGAPLHAPRGMAITGDTLWAADVDGLHGFNRRTGAPAAFIDFSSHDTGFLNDVVPGPDGTLYVTDTGRDRVYRVAGRDITVALEDTLLNRPNGITWDEANGRFIIVPYGGGHGLFSWQPGGALEEIATSPGAQFDGVEVLPGGRLLVASQADSSLHLFSEGSGRAFIRTSGRPADIGVDTERHRVAVPFIALNQVEIWQLPHP